MAVRARKTFQKTLRKNLRVPSLLGAGERAADVRNSNFHKCGSCFLAGTSHDLAACDLVSDGPVPISQAAKIGKSGNFPDLEFAGVPSQQRAKIWGPFDDEGATKFLDASRH